jgi:hypothetical protein
LNEKGIDAAYSGNQEEKFIGKLHWDDEQFHNDTMPKKYQGLDEKVLRVLIAAAPD